MEIRVWRFQNYRDCGYTCNPHKFEIPALQFPCRVPVIPCKHLQCTSARQIKIMLHLSTQLHTLVHKCFLHFALAILTQLFFLYAKSTNNRLAIPMSNSLQLLALENASQIYQMYFEAQCTMVGLSTRPPFLIIFNFF